MLPYSKAYTSGIAKGVQVEIRTNPCGFFRRFFKVKPFKWMEAVLNAVFVDGAKKVGVSGAFSIGKTWFEPRLALMWELGFITSTSDAIVGIGAPKDEHAKKKFWGEFAKMYDTARMDIGGNFLLSGEWRSGKKPMSSIETIIPGQKVTSTGKAAHGGFGTHADYVLGVIDEAQGVEQAIFDAYDNATSSGHSCLIVFGNPVSQDGAFYEHCKNKKTLHISISALDHPNVIAFMKGQAPVIPAAISPTWLDSKVFEHCTPVDESKKSALAFQWYSEEGRVDEHGQMYPLIWYEPDSWFVANGLGQFPDVTKDAPVPYAKAVAASERQVTILGMPTYCGLDIAEQGSAETVFDFRYMTEEGVWFHKQIALTGSNEGADVINEARKYLNMFPRMRLAGDAIGVGSAVMSVLVREFPDRVLAVKWSPKAAVGMVEMEGGAVPANTVYADFKTQLQIAVADRYCKGMIANELDKEFISQATSIRHTTSKDGRITMVSKKPTRTQIENVQSHHLDKWDARCYSYVFEFLDQPRPIYTPREPEVSRGMIPAEAGVQEYDEGDYRTSRVPAGLPDRGL